MGKRASYLTTILFRSEVSRICPPARDVYAHLDAYFEMLIARAYPFYIFKNLAAYTYFIRRLFFGS